MSAREPDVTFDAYCPECEQATWMENIGHVIKCTSCGYLLTGVPGEDA